MFGLGVGVVAIAVAIVVVVVANALYVIARAPRDRRPTSASRGRD